MAGNQPLIVSTSKSKFPQCSCAEYNFWPPQNLGMTWITGSSNCKIQSCCSDGQIPYTINEKINRPWRKNSKIKLVSSCPFENGSKSKLKTCSNNSLWNSNTKNLKSRRSPEKKGSEGALAKNGDNWCDCRNLPAYDIKNKKVVCLPPCEKKPRCSGINVCIRRVPIIPKSQLKIPCAPFDNYTTYKVEYPAKEPCPSKPIKPSSKLIRSSEPILSETTYRNCYQAKPCSKRDAIYPANEMFKSGQPMEGKTTTMSDYKVPQGFIPASSFCPDHSYHPPSDPLDDKTIHKIDYVPWNTRGPVGPFPWTPGNKYVQPNVPMYGDTTYKTSYTPKHGEVRLPPFAPKSMHSLNEDAYPADFITIYKRDYPGRAGFYEREPPIRIKDNMKPCKGRFEDRTVYKDTYNGRVGDRPKPILPASNCHLGEGSLSSDTTHRADYQAKPYSKRNPFVICSGLSKPKGPMEGMTTSMSAYKIPQGFIPASSFRPDNCYHPSSNPLDDKTTHKVDYVPWNVRGPVGPYPWTPGNKYVQPTSPMQGDTTYKTSYEQPECSGKTKPIIPNEQGIGFDGSQFDGTTTYKNDYQPCQIVNEGDCYDPNEYVLGGKPPCDAEQQRTCYKVDGVCPYYPNAGPQNLDSANSIEPVVEKGKIMNVPLRKLSVPILCC